MDRKHMNMMTRESINIMVILMMGYPNAIDIELHKSSIVNIFSSNSDNPPASELLLHAQSRTNKPRLVLMCKLQRSGYD